MRIKRLRNKAHRAGAFLTISVRRSETRVYHADNKERDIRDSAMASRATLALGRGRPRCGPGCGPNNPRNLFYPKKTEIY
jgi:hypothetical protein